MAMDIIAHPLKEKKRVTVIEVLFSGAHEKLQAPNCHFPAKTLTEDERMAEEGKNEVADKHSHVAISHARAVYCIQTNKYSTIEKR